VDVLIQPHNKIKKDHHKNDGLFFAIRLTKIVFCLYSFLIMKVDYIIVGAGLAGIAFCEQLKANNKTFVVFDDNSQQSSVVAGGLYNAVVLKRFTPVWKSQDQLNLALPLYNNIENKLNIKLDYKIPVYRKFASLEEQNNWFTASDNPRLSEYLSTQIVKNTNQAVNAPLGFGKVLKTGRIDVKTLVRAYREDLQKKDLLFKEAFQYNELNLKATELIYKNIMAKQIVFAEGFGMVKNPFFKHLPLVPTKGELLIIEAPELKIDYVLKSGAFVIPLGNHKYIIGATYEWNDLNHKATEQAKEKLLSRLEKIINCQFKIVNQVAGVRPTVIDRRPLVGRHQAHKNMYLLNGLGTRGVMIGPYVAQELFSFIEKDQPLDQDIDIARFSEQKQ